jgi:GTP-binding protein HflX
LAQIGADTVPELVVVNKTDAADETGLARLERQWPAAVFVSARTGAGLTRLRAVVEDNLPWPAVDVHACVPYTRGDLIARAHTTGEVLSTEHTADGTLLHVRVDEALAAELAPYTGLTGTPAGRAG